MWKALAVAAALTGGPALADAHRDCIEMVNTAYDLAGRLGELRPSSSRDLSSAVNTDEGQAALRDLVGIERAFERYVESMLAVCASVQRPARRD